MMDGFFRIHELLYKFGYILYYLFVSNILWVIFSIPIFTMGASTTALFYVMGRIVRNDDVKVFKNFWSSFKQNFRQSTVIWLVLLAVSFVIYINIENASMLGNLSKVVLPVHLTISFEIIIVTIYTFPLLSRFEMGTMNLFKASLVLGNKHILTTLLCLSSIFVTSFLLFIIPGFLILVFMSLNAMFISFLMNRIFKLKYYTEIRLESPDAEANLLQ